MTLKTIWVGKSRLDAKLQEKKAIKKYGDAIMSSGAVILKGKETMGYAVSVPLNLMKSKPKPKKEVLKEDLRQRGFGVRIPTTDDILKGARGW